jgi:hypothetical protein
MRNPLAWRTGREGAHCLSVSLYLFSRCIGGIFAAQYTPNPRRNPLIVSMDTTTDMIKQSLQGGPI